MAAPDCAKTIKRPKAVFAVVIVLCLCWGLQRPGGHGVLLRGAW